MTHIFRPNDNPIAQICQPMVFVLLASISFAANPRQSESDQLIPKSSAITTGSPSNNLSAFVETLNKI